MMILQQSAYGSWISLTFLTLTLLQAQIAADHTAQHSAIALLLMATALILIVVLLCIYGTLETEALLLKKIQHTPTAQKESTQLLLLFSMMKATLHFVPQLQQSLQ